MLFITFEGGEGSGKSTQAKLLHQKLQQHGVSARLIHEPGVTLLGEEIARLLKWAQEIDVSPVAELLLFNAARAQLVTEVIRPALDNDDIVICDRYADSTVAYQGYGRGLDLSLVQSANRTGTLGLTPDMTFLLDVSTADGLQRKSGTKKDRFEVENSGFHQRVREGYLKLAADEPSRWLVIDATGKKEKIAGIIWEKVNRLLSSKR
jgi:dTMP kinase